MRRYAWVTAVCLAALMAGGCGNQTGQETKQNSVSVSESAASGEPEAKSDDVGSDGDAVKEAGDGLENDEEGKNEKGASAVKLEEGEIYRIWTGMRQRKKFLFLLRVMGKMVMTSKTISIF